MISLVRLELLLKLLALRVLAEVPFYFQLQPLFFNGGQYPGAPLAPPSGFSPNALYNTSYDNPTNFTIDINGFSPFVISNPYGFFMPPVVVVINGNLTSTSNGTIRSTTGATSTTTRSTTPVPPVVVAPPGQGNRFFVRSKWRKD